MIINIFFREIRPRGAFNIPREGAVLFICGPHANQFLDPLLLFSEVRKEAHRRVAVLIAAKVCLYLVLTRSFLTRRRA